jgi:hypothetical protein
MMVEQERKVSERRDNHREHIPTFQSPPLSERRVLSISLTKTGQEEVQTSLVIPFDGAHRQRGEVTLLQEDISMVFGSVQGTCINGHKVATSQASFLSVYNSSGRDMIDAENADQEP